MKNEAKDNKKSGSNPVSRRSFLGKSAIAAASMTIIPRHVLGGSGFKAPSDMVNIAGIGVGARGGSNIRSIATPDVAVEKTYTGYPRVSERSPTIQRQQTQQSAQITPGTPSGTETYKHANIYALCDVDSKYAEHMFAGYPAAKQYTDFRKMIDTEKEIDAVLIGTPDHTHAVIAAYAMAAGKHVAVEKPMTKTIYEARKLAQLAKKYNVVTQMGNQGHNVEGTYQTIEWIQSGKIGWVREVHMWSNRPSWPQGFMNRPIAQPVPNHLDYDLWLGPAPEKGYNFDCTHFNWRGLRDYGTGAMGDMGAHTFDAPILALNLGMPTEIQATSTPFTEDYLPKAEFITYYFPARGGSPEVKVTWQDGGLKPYRPDGLEPGRQLREALYIGDKGMIMHGTHGANPELIPNEPGFSVEPWLERPKSIYIDFIEAIKEGRKAKNDFEISAKLTEIMLLANIAVAAQQINLTLQYDAENVKITNLPEANDYFHYEYRKGWEQYLEV
jgi:predicted dehydrogenase